MDRIEATFKRLKDEGRTGLIAFLTVGFPDVDATMELVPAIVEAGADLVELGVPFSDPLADGATIQRSSQVALRNGVTLATCLQLCGRLRTRVPLVPLILMGYYNPILAYGLDRFAGDAVAAGADGVIVPDLPPEEAGPLLLACRSHGLQVAFLLAPTSPDRRIQEVGRQARGFIYCVSVTGVTGARDELPQELPSFIARVRRQVAQPLAVGIGVSTQEQVRAIGGYADAAVVGSALVGVVEGAPPSERVERAARFTAGLHRATLKT